MVNKEAISRNLRELDTRYNRKTRNLRDPLYYSKLALLELCGWIEVTMDGIVLDCAQKHLTRHSNLNYVQDSIIHRTFGFAYDPQFRTMLIRVVGLVKVEQLEDMYDQQKFDAMRSSLGWLKQRRDQEAHTYIAGVTHTLDAPSVVNNHFQNVYQGLKDIERFVRMLKF